jgi:histidine triad (HIT) family protein
MTVMSENCVFCQIVRKETPANIVYEDEQVVGFLTNRPVNDGHTLVIPKRHSENIYEISEDEAAYLFKVVKRVAHAIRDAMGAKDIRIVQNNGETAGQVVFHFHIHVIPMKPYNRFEHDGAFRGSTNYQQVEVLKKTAEKIRRKISNIL